MSIWDDEAGYDRDDPKHPDFAEMWFEFADMVRKRQKEDQHEAEFRRKNPEGDWIREQQGSLSEPDGANPGVAPQQVRDLPGSESEAVENYERKP